MAQSVSICDRINSRYGHRNSWRPSDLWWFPWILHICGLGMPILYYVHVQKQHCRKSFQTVQEAYSWKIYTWIYLYCNCINVSVTKYCGQNKAYLHLFLVTHHELCEQPHFVRWWDHGYEHCKLYPIHVYSNSSMDKQMYDTVSTMFLVKKFPCL